MNRSIAILTVFATLCLKTYAQTELPQKTMFNPAKEKGLQLQNNQPSPALMQMREDVINGKKTTVDLEMMIANNGSVYMPGRTKEGFNSNLKSTKTAATATVINNPATSVYHLTKDINALTSSSPYNNNLLNYLDIKFAVLNKVAYFWADDGVNGSELWRSDGTPAGTYMVKDISPGSLSSGGGEIVAAGNKIYFSIGPDQLWTSDGTEAGTQFIKTIPNTGGNRIADFFAAGDGIYFVATTLVSGSLFNQLWRSDGTSAGTVLLYDDGNYNPGWGMSHFAYVNGILYFTNTNNANGYEVWRSDGTAIGTHILKDVNPDAYDYYGQGPDNLTVYNNQVYFTESDGTARRLFVADASGTTASLAPGNNNVTFDPNNYSLFANIPFAVSNGLMYFQGSSPATGNELYHYDAVNGEVLLKDITAGTGSTNLIRYGAMADVNNVLYFGLINTSNQYELWATKGKTNTTARIKQLNPGEFFSGFFNANGTLVFQKKDAVYGSELWKSDGTDAGTLLIKDIYSGPYGSGPGYLTLTGNKILFSAYTATTANELWTTNLTDAGTKQVKDINKSSTESSYAGGYFKSITGFGNGAIFAASTKETGTELFQSDGSAAGTSLVKDIVPGEVGPSPQFFINKNNYVYFRGGEQGTDGNIVSVIYRSDGTNAGTVKMVSVNSSIERFAVADNGLLFYIAYNNNTSSYELYRSDGTVPGTFSLASGIYYDTYPVTAGNTAFFVNADGTYGTELWSSDGTVSGTKIVKDINPGPTNSAPYSITAFNGNIYFGANDGLANSFWRSNGTEAGTIKLSNAEPYFQNYFDYNQHYCVSNNTLYFVATDAVNGTELWKTTGTVNSTKLVKDIYPGNFGSYPGYLADVNGVIYFTATEPVYGQELWGSNGTASGTKLIKDITPGNNGSFFTYPPAEAAGKYYFTLYDTLWVSGGTAASTKQVKDAGLSGLQYIQNMTGTPTKLFFSAYTYQYGYELYVGDLAPGAATIASTDDAVIVSKLDAKLYPNPVKDAARLSVSGDVKKLSISVSDMNGKNVWQQTFSNAAQITLPAEKLSAGIYFVTVTNGTESKVLKLVKQ